MSSNIGTHRQEVLLGTVEEEDEVVPEGAVRLHEQVQHFQHDGAAEEEAIHILRLK